MNIANLLLHFGCVSIAYGQSLPYGRGYYSSVVTPTSRYTIRHGAGSSGDLISDESKHRLEPKYSKKHIYKGYNSDEEDISSEGYSSDEYSNEAKHLYSSKENDSREYTIGTHIRVQHPITIPKKSTIAYPTKSSKYTPQANVGGYSLDLSHEDRGADSYFPITTAKKSKYSKPYEPDPFQVISPPKSKGASYHQTPSSGYGTNFNVHEQEIESYENADLAVKHLKANLRDRYKSVASKNQIEKYLEDQEKLLDEALKLQLLNSPKFQKLLKTAEKEHQFKLPEFEDEYIANVPHTFRDSFHRSGPPKSSRIRRLPPKPKSSLLSSPSRKYRSAFVISV